MTTLKPAAIAKLSDDEVIERLHECMAQSKRLLGQLILLLIQVANRRLDLKAATPSPFEFCVRRLGMSEGEAYRRTAAARLVARFPRLLPHIERGDVHLSALVQLRDYFTDENVDDLVLMAKKKNKMEIAEIVARLAPRPDVPARLRKLPQHDARPRLEKARKPAIDPLSEGRYRLQVTGSRAFRDKLLRARDLMMHSNPTGDLAVVVERAIDELLEVLEKRIFGKLSTRESKGSKAPATALEEDVAIATARATDSDERALEAARSGLRRPGLARASTAGSVTSTSRTPRHAVPMKLARSRTGLAPAQVARAGGERRGAEGGGVKRH